MLDRAGGSVVEPGFLVGLGELDAVAGGEGAPAVGAFKLVILAEPAKLPVDFARALVQLGNVEIGVGENETRFVRRCGNVVPVGVEQFGAGFALGARPVNRALGLIDAKRIMKFPFREILAARAGRRLCIAA